MNTPIGDPCLHWAKYARKLEQDDELGDDDEGTIQNLSNVANLPKAALVAQLKCTGFELEICHDRKAG